MRWRILNKLRSQELKDRREEIIKILLENRGLKTAGQQKEFLTPPNPLNLTPKDVGIAEGEIKKALKRIKQALKKKEKIIVYGDYDTDGVCATAIIWEALHQLKAQVMPFIPKREEGYGLKIDRVEEMAKNGINLLITVDQGIVQIKQAARAKKLGLDLIITDHHVPGKEKPKAAATIHTTKLAGAGVAWFLVKEFLGSKEAEKSLDLATIGTITDIANLTGPNRALVKFGQDYVKKTKRQGILALYKLAGVEKEKIGTYEIGYIIGPRINAAGRMENPMESLRLICTKNEKRAAELAKAIDQKNKERQDLTNMMVTHARELWLKEDGKSVLIFVQHESYQEGIIGLVASKLMEEFYRPVVVVAKGKEWSRASARSIEEFNIVEAVRICEDIIGSHGGHKKAAGFDVETTKIELVKQRLIGFAEENLDKKHLIPTLKIDAEVTLDDLGIEFLEMLKKFEPFGEGNRAPVFATRGVMIADAKLVGKTSKHLSLMIKDEKSKKTIRAIGFGLGGFYFQLSPGKPVDIAYNLIEDTWNGQGKLQLKLKDIKT